jgi:type II secretory pathway component PulK
MRERRMGPGVTISPTRWAISYPTPDAPLLRALV